MIRHIHCYPDRNMEHIVAEQNLVKILPVYNILTSYSIVQRYSDTFCFGYNFRARKAINLKLSHHGGTVWDNALLLFCFLWVWKKKLMGLDIIA